MGLNRDLIGKQYPEKTCRIDAETARAYARATNEDNPLLAGPDAWCTPASRCGSR